MYQFISGLSNTRESMAIVGKGKAVPLQAWGGPEGSRKLRFPDFMSTHRMVVRKYTWYSFPVEAESTPGP
jgi:hypothetical protein